MSAGASTGGGSTVTLHVVSSLDGFIARHDNSVAWLDGYDEVYEKGVVEGAGDDADESVYCFVLGSRTYEHALQLGWPYGETPTIVTTTRPLQTSRQNVEFYSGDLSNLVTRILAPRYRQIWLVGGADLCQKFLALRLVDEIRLTIAPILLGGGLRLFGDSESEQRWRLKDVVSYRNGFVQLVYWRRPA
jgi:dihydrofolate reductase